MRAALATLTILVSIPLAVFGQVHSEPNSDFQQHGTARLSSINLPIAFEENRGQADSRDTYIAHVGGMTLGFSTRHVEVHLPQEKNSLNLSFGGGTQPNLSVLNKTGGESNYLIGSSPENWRTHVSQYGRLTYSNLYPGIDLTFYGNGKELEHDFIVAPGADYRIIRMHYDGVKSLSLTATGALRLSMQQGVVEMKSPRIYQMNGDIREDRKGQFVLMGKNEVGFRIEHVDPERQLIIDPILNYATYLATAALNVDDVAVDSSGNTYILGDTAAAYPTTSGSFQQTCSSCVNQTDVFVTKLNATGTAQIYSTYLGGGGGDRGIRIVVDGSGNAIAAGMTESLDFPLKNPVVTPAGPNSGGIEDAFITSIAPDGASLNFSSRLGSSANPVNVGMTYVSALAVDSTGAIYAGGATESAGFPVTTGALQNGSPRYSNKIAFLTKLQSTGALVFSGLLGDPGTGGIYWPGPVAIFPGDSAITVAGVAFPTNTVPWPTTNGAYGNGAITQQTSGSFVTKVAADCSTILVSAVIPNLTVAGAAINQNHEVVLGGGAGTALGVTSDAYATHMGLSGIAKLNADSGQLAYASYFSTPSWDTGADIRHVAVDSNDNVWVSGGTPFSQAIPLEHPIQALYGYQGFPNGSAFVSQFDPQIHTLLFSTYFNGPKGGTNVGGMAIDSQNRVHIAGAAAEDLPTTSGAYLATQNGPVVRDSWGIAYGYAAMIDPTQAGPGICFSPMSLAPTQVGSSKQGTLTITNCGNAPLNISNVSVSGSAFSLVSADSCLTALSESSICTVAFNFTPTVAGYVAGSIAIASDAPVRSYTLAISGQATAPKASFLGAGVNFPPQVQGDDASATIQVAVVQNSGTAPLIVDPTQLSVTAGFEISNNGCKNPVPINSVCFLQLKFHPTALGVTTGTLTVVSNDPVNPQISLPLSGSLIASYPAASISYLNKPTIASGTTSFTLGVIGSNFFPTSYVLMNGQRLSSVSMGPTSINVTVDPALIAIPGELSVAVVNPAPGGSSNLVYLNVYRSVPITASGLVYDPASRLLYAAVPASATANPNTIVSIDPTTGNVVGTPIPVGGDPRNLALSDDGTYLYVAARADSKVQRINLATKQVERSFTLPLDPYYSHPTAVIDMHVVPGSPKLIVASLYGTSSEVGAVLIDDSGTVQYLPNRVNPTIYFSLDNFAFTSDPTLIYGYPLRDSFFNITSVQPTWLTPVTVSNTSCCSGGGSLVVSDGTLLYTNGGQVWDPVSKNLLGTYPGLNFESSVLPDTLAHRTYMLDTSVPYHGYGGYVTILSFDQTTFAQVDSLAFVTSGAAALQRWGADGFAFINGSQIIITSSHIAGAAPGASMTSSLMPASALAGSGAFTLTVNGSGFKPTAIVSWNGSPRVTTYVSPTRLKAQILAADIQNLGTAQVTVANSSTTLASGAVLFVINQLTLSVSPASITFGNVAVGLAAPAQNVTLTAGSAGALNDLSVAISGASAGDFSQTNSCNTISAAQTCTVAIGFTPSAAGTRNAILSISATGVPVQSIPLSGVGGSPSLILSAIQLDLGSQVVNTTSAAKSVTITNSGSASASAISLSISGPYGTDFVQTNNCGTSLAAGANCTVNITFRPSVSAAEQASLFINAANTAQQTISLSGTGTLQTFAVNSSGSSTNMVQAGQPATYQFNLAATNNFNGQVTLGCTGLPMYASCTFTPSTLSLGSGGTASFTLNVSTQQTATAQLIVSSNIFFAILFIPPLLFSRPNRSTHRAKQFCILVLLISASLVVLSGCSGSSPSAPSTGGGPITHNTPTGSYTINVVATSASSSYSTPITLVVQ